MKLLTYTDTVARKFKIAITNIIKNFPKTLDTVPKMYYNAK